MRSSAIILGLLAASASTNAAPAAFLDWFMSNDNELQSPIILEQQEIVKPLVDSEELQSYINAEGLEARANKLYSLAQKSQKKYKHPTRVIGSKGHWSTIGYVMAELGKLGHYYNITTQPFHAFMGEIYNVSLIIDGVSPKEVIEMDLSPPTPNRKPVTGSIILVENEGCDASDFPAEINGNIALIKRGSCAFGDKSRNAGAAGAIAAIVYNNEPGSIRGTLGTPSGPEVATLGLSMVEGEQYVQLLKDGKALTAELLVDSFVGPIKTVNVIAESKLGDPENIVMLGAHSDSVTAGPGINDDGSGTISLLEVATYLSNFTVNNKVRFAWWAAEEEGLLGSDYYVSQLSPEENSKIRLFMDYDMMASPNFAYQVYNASNVYNPVGSEELKELYIDWYESHGLNYTLIPFDGRSDYDGFIKNGIPGGGIATGAEVIKTPEEEEMFGGEAGIPFDPCYHQLCDDLSNLNYTAFVTNTKLIAHSVATYAKSFEGFPERENTTDATTILLQNPEDISMNNFKYHGSKLIM
ncbi:peptidase activity protein [[Candida] boidinii]|nr:peptidase activity protein [[Candida] boidinii]OWB59550.1 peptidase activity protein [[Candida] boidinii]